MVGDRSNSDGGLSTENLSLNTQIEQLRCNIALKSQVESGSSCASIWSRIMKSESQKQRVYLERKKTCAIERNTWRRKNAIASEEG